MKNSHSLGKRGSAELRSAGHFFPHGKKGDVEAFLLIIAVPLIIISILAFYFFAADELSIGQQSQIEANLAIIKLDEGLSGLKIPPDTNAKQMSTLLEDFLAKNKYKTLLPPGMQQEICTGDITCNIMVKSPYTNHKKTYYREIIIPTEKGTRTIKIQGELYE